MVESGNFRGNGNVNPSGEPQLSLAVATAPQREVSERLLKTEVVCAFMDSAVAQTAALAWLIRKVGPFPGETEGKFKIRLDEWPTKLMEGIFNRSLFGINIVGCEGDKEKRSGGAKDEVYTIRGFHGGVDKRLGKVNSVIDPVEGTKELLKDGPNATATSGSSLTDEVPLTPPDFLDPEKTIQSDALYLNRVILGPDFIGAEPGMSLEEIFEIGRRSSGIIDIRQIRAVVLKRTRNEPLIRRLQDIGVSLDLIEGGDLIPGLAALKGSDKSARPEDRVLVTSWGSGGKEEARIAFKGARAKKCIAWGRYEDDKGNPSEQFPGLQTLDILVPGKAENVTVNIAGITGIDPKWFSVPSVEAFQNGKLTLTVHGFSITAKDGFKPTKRVCTVSKEFLSALADHNPLQLSGNFSTI